LGILEPIAQYDTFLSDHMKNHGNRGSGHTNYLSSTICEEIFDIIATRVSKEIIRRRKVCKFYSVSVDATTDEGHVDLMAVVVRYLEESSPKERFLCYLPNQGHNSREMFDGLNSALKNLELDFKDIRGQSYDCV